MKLDSTVCAVVIGAASGLGEAVARALAQQGVKVAIFDLAADRGQAVAAGIGGIFQLVDITSDDSVAAGFAAARALQGQERILVNCAGVAPGGKIASRDRATGLGRPHAMALFERVVAINLVGTFRCAAWSAAGMLNLDPLEDGERGVIINTASIAAEEGQVGQSAYAASKAGVIGLTLPAARDLAADGVRVNAILPGAFGTPMIDGMPDAVRQGLEATIPFPSRLGAPEEYASLALEICRNRYLNGAAIRIDGAVRMPPR
jgi:NAD(P)-dependent dehydrogenase (short-subunit alcohol dehydrogenase family)